MTESIDKTTQPGRFLHCNEYGMAEVAIPLEPPQFAFFITPSSAFTKEGWGRKVQRAGGSYESRPPANSRRKIILPNTPAANELAQHLIHNFCDPVSNCVAMRPLGCYSEFLPAPTLPGRILVGEKNPFASCVEQWHPFLLILAQKDRGDVRINPESSLEPEPLDVASVKRRIDEVRALLSAVENAPISKVLKLVENADTRLQGLSVQLEMSLPRKVS